MKHNSKRIERMRSRGWLTIGEMAEREGVTPTTLRRWLARGEHPGAKVVGGMMMFPPSVARTEGQS